MNVDVDENGSLFLNTGNQSIDPDRIVIPFDQDVWVSFFYEDAGNQSTLGYVLADDAVDASGKFLGWKNIPSQKKHAIFRKIADGSGGGNGILDIVEGRSETGVSLYDDGTGLPFAVDGDGRLSPRDMRKHLGRFAGGTELVFFLGSNQDIGSSQDSQFFYTRTEWNPDVYTYNACSRTYRVYDLGAASSGNCSTERKGLLDQNAIDRLRNEFDLTLSGERELLVEQNKKFPHVLVAAPDEDPNQWILSWEDLRGDNRGLDMDYNDTTFRIERRTGGMAELKGENAITPEAAQAYYTGATFQVYDEIPGDSCMGKAAIRYYVAIGENGANDPNPGKPQWVEIRQWDQVREFTLDNGERVLGDAVPNWTPGAPPLTFRSARIDFAGMGLSGRNLVWKAEMISEDEGCAPRIAAAQVDGHVATHAFFSRSTPVMLGNVLYSGSYETPDGTWGDKRLRGHIKATRLYDPVDPSQLAQAAIWDGGEELQGQNVNQRTIYFPDLRLHSVSHESLTVTTPDGTETTKGDGESRTFTGRLAHFPVVATTVRIGADTKILTDAHTDRLKGEWGEGTIDRFTGAFEITFNTPPAQDVPITASYSWYETESAMKAFVTANVDNDMLALDDTHIIPQGYIYDFDGDGDYDAADGSWLVNWVRGTGQEWKLGALDHSTPAVLTPPGMPQWYYGSDIPAEEKASYREFKNNHATRPTVLFVGARDGMLHAFDAGEFRWGDNERTGVIENRGYFEWSGNAPDYGTGEEVWAFIPTNLLSRLKNNKLQTDDQAYVDASPALADISVGGAWKSVVLSAEGNGGDTVFCLDVTDPLNPQFMWEFADPDLFRSRSSPAVGQIGRILVNGMAKWVAFIVSGKNDPSAYPSIYVLDVSDGSVVRRIYLDAAEEGRGGVPSGQPAIIDSDGNGYIDRLYIGTDKGRMYKVNLSDKPGSFLGEMNQCVVNTDFIDDDGGGRDIFNNRMPQEVPEDQRWHPIYASPTVMVDNRIDDGGQLDRSVRLFFGTGDSPYYDENIDTGNTQYHFFAYRDSAGKMSCQEEEVELDWFQTLPAGQRVFASAFASAGKIYFGTSTAETENPCEGPNEGQLYILDMDDPTSGEALDTGNITTAPMVSDQHLFIQAGNEKRIIGDGGFNNAVPQGSTAKARVKAWREVREP